MTKSAIITGASSGIGEHLARRMSRAGYEVGLTARSLGKLQEIGEELPTRSYVARMDVTETEEAREVFRELVESMGEVDVVVLNAGIAPMNKELDWELDRATIDTNVRGFAALATAAIDEFEAQGQGQLVGISSVSAHVGLSHEPAYSGSKAFVSNYLEGIRFRAHDRDADVTVTTIEPGYVDTRLSIDDFWECSPETAAKQIFTAIENERKHVYVTRRWQLIGLFLDWAPDVLKRQFV